MICAVCDFKNNPVSINSTAYRNESTNDVMLMTIRMHAHLEISHNVRCDCAHIQILIQSLRGTDQLLTPYDMDPTALLGRNREAVYVLYKNQLIVF